MNALELQQRVQESLCSIIAGYLKPEDVKTVSGLVGECFMDALHQMDFPTAVPGLVSAVPCAARQILVIDDEEVRKRTNCSFRYDIVEKVMEKPHGAYDREWFLQHAILRLCYVYSTSAVFRRLFRHVENNQNKGEAQANVYARDWLTEYIKDQEGYKAKMPHRLFRYIHV